MNEKKIIKTNNIKKLRCTALMMVSSLVLSACSSIAQTSLVANQVKPSNSAPSTGVANESPTVNPTSYQPIKPNGSNSSQSENPTSHQPNNSNFENNVKVISPEISTSNPQPSAQPIIHNLKNGIKEQFSQISDKGMTVKLSNLEKIHW